MRIFISGGCKNGKSYYAQRLAKQQKTRPLYYIATMAPTDSEDRDRIERHRYERAGWGFETVEQHCRIEDILYKCDTNGSFLLDSLTALLACEMFPQSGVVDIEAAERIAVGLKKVLEEIENIVIVSDYIYSDAVLFDPLTEKYRESLAKLDKTAAANCDRVIEVAYSCVIEHKKVPDGL